MKRLFNYKYPKLTLLLVSIILAYYIFSNDAFISKINHLGALGYIGSFIAGFLFSFGFSTPFAVGFFLTYSPDNILLTAIVGAFGAFAADALLFRFIKVSFMDEFNSIKKNIRFKKHHNFLTSKVRLYLVYLFVGIIIASPLPDELGVSLLSGFTKLKFSIFSVVSLLMNFLGILIMLFLANI